MNAGLRRRATSQYRSRSHNMSMRPIDFAALGLRPSRALFALLATACPVLAWAHPGHGEGVFLSGLLHALHGWDHVLAAVAVGIWAARLGGRALWALPVAFVGAMAVGVGAAAAGWQLPMAESAIAASLLALGALIALDARFASVAGALIVALFAPFHGAAHVAEMPSQSAVASFALGLLLSTGLLHAGGIGAAVAARKYPVLLRLAGAPVALAGAWAMLAPAL
jgi:urease accessory protein